MTNEQVPKSHPVDEVLDVLSDERDKEWSSWAEMYMEIVRNGSADTRKKRISAENDPHIAFLSGFAAGHRLAMSKAIELIEIARTEPED